MCVGARPDLNVDAPIGDTVDGCLPIERRLIGTGFAVRWFVPQEEFRSLRSCAHRSDIGYAQITFRSEHLPLVCSNPGFVDPISGNGKDVSECTYKQDSFPSRNSCAWECHLTSKSLLRLVTSLTVLTHNRDTPNRDTICRTILPQEDFRIFALAPAAVISAMRKLSFVLSIGSLPYTKLDFVDPISENGN